jgi:putative ABC transport system permease protein
MSFWTALKLSGMNIATKKWRTTLTAFASSIGIIGIALILSLSNGFDKQISTFESNTVAGYPIMILKSASDIDTTKMKDKRNEMMGIGDDSDKFPAEKKIYPYDEDTEKMKHKNVLTEDYMKYIEKIPDSLLAGVSTTRLVNMNILKCTIVLVAP